ncbi:MAG TPA: 2-C-methyl-D-erythritol 4-phosphate cytidylyltransferase [Tepidisphaeraceae bacterium]
MAATFSVLLLTAAPPAHATESGGPFVKIDGREALLRSAELFLNRPEVKQIQIVFPEDGWEEYKRKFGGHLGFSGVKLLSGASRWIDQMAVGAKSIAEEATHVIVHDTARPAVAYSDLDNLVAAAEKHPVVVLTSPLKANLIEVDEAAHPVAYHQATNFVQLLSPQCYRKDKFIQAATNKQEPHASEMTLVKGSPLNVRCSGPGDASYMKSLLNHLPKPKAKGPLTPFEEAQW